MIKTVEIEYVGIEDIQEITDDNTAEVTASRDTIILLETLIRYGIVKKNYGKIVKMLLTLRLERSKM